MLPKVSLTKVIAVWFMVLVTIAAVVSKKVFNVEDLVLHNPSYMVAEYNSISFPIYEYYSNGSWNGMWVHPPIHYTVIGLLMKLVSVELALNLYYLILTGLLFLSIISLKVEERVKIPLLIGAFLFVVSKFSLYQNFSFRPEMAIALCWVSGSLFLECARQRHWNSRYIIIGVLLISYGACSHYFAYLSSSTIGVYLIAYLLGNGFHWKAKALRAFIITSLVIAALYLTLFIFPFLPQILNWFSGVSAPVKIFHFPFGVLKYHLQIHSSDPSFFFQNNLPAGILACFIFTLFRKFRILGFAFLPYVLFLTFTTTGKKLYYGFPEWLIGDLAIALLIGTCVYYLAALLYPLNKNKNVIRYGASLLLVLASAKVVFLSGEKEFQYQPHPINVLRSLSQVTTGTSSLIGGRHGLWYVSGAAKWYSEEVSIWNRLPDSMNTYLQNSDYFAMYWLMPNDLEKWRFEGAYIKHEIGLKAVILGNASPFCMYSGKKDTASKYFDFSIMTDSVHRFLPDTTGNYLVGAFAIYMPDDSAQVMANATSCVFFETKLNGDSMPRQVAFAAIDKIDSLGLNLKSLETFRASKKSYSFNQWMKEHPLKNKHVVFYKTQEDALNSRK